MLTIKKHKIPTSKLDFIICIFGLILNIAIFFPGFMSVDSLFQYNQSVSLDLIDSHPVIMALIWRPLNFIFGAPQGLLIFQLSMLWGSIYLLRKKFKNNKYSIFIYFLGISPWLINFSGVLWKDIEMAYSILLALCIYFTFKGREKYIPISLLLFYASAVRQNGILAIYPLLFYFINNEKKCKPITALLAATLISIFFIALNYFLTFNVFKAIHSYTFNNIMLDDLTALSIIKREALIPNISYTLINLCSNFKVADTVLAGKDFCYTLKYNLHEVLFSKSLFNEWIKNILADPYEYLKFRYKLYLEFLRLPNLKPYYFWHDGIAENSLGFKIKNPGLVFALGSYIEISAKILSIFFKPYFWLVISWLTYIYISVRKIKNTDLVKILLISANTYGLSYFFIAPIYDFRYFYLPVLFIELGIILTVMNVINQKSIKR